MAHTGETVRLNSSDVDEYVVPRKFIARSSLPIVTVAEMPIGSARFVEYDRNVIVDSQYRCWLRLDAVIDKGWHVKVIRSPSGYSLAIDNLGFVFNINHNFNIDNHREEYVPVRRIIPCNGLIMGANPIRVFLAKYF